MGKSPTWIMLREVTRMFRGLKPSRHVEMVWNIPVTSRQQAYLLRGNGEIGDVRGKTRGCRGVCLSRTCHEEVGIVEYGLHPAGRHTSGQLMDDKGVWMNAQPALDLVDYSAKCSTEWRFCRCVTSPPDLSTYTDGNEACRHFSSTQLSTIFDSTYTCTSTVHADRHRWTAQMQTLRDVPTLTWLTKFSLSQRGMYINWVLIMEIEPTTSRRLGAAGLRVCWAIVIPSAASLNHWDAAGGCYRGCNNSAETRPWQLVM